MEDNHSTSVVDEAKSAENLTITELTNRRLGKFGEDQETKVVEFDANEKEPEGEEEVPESSAPEEPKEESQDVLSQIDLDSLSEDEIGKLAEKIGSRAVDRFGQLTKRAKTAEEQLAQLQSEVNSNPLDTGKVRDNPLSDIATIDTLRDKAEETAQVIEWAEDVLFNSDDYGANDVVTEIEGKELTKADVRKSLQSARKDRDKYIPAQLKVVQASENADKLKGQIEKIIPEELPWTQDEANDVNQRYKAMVSDPRLEQLEGPPELLAQLPYLLAHAANSMFGAPPKQEVPEATKTVVTPKITPPSSPSSGMAEGERNEGNQSKALKQREGQFRKSGKKSDWVTLRTLKLQNRI